MIRQVILSDHHICVLIEHMCTFYIVFFSFTQCCSIAKSVGCFQRRPFVCLCVCQHDNFQTSKHRMMKLGGRCIVRESRPSSNLGVIAPFGVLAPLGLHLQKCGIGLQCWQNQRRLSSSFSLFYVLCVRLYAK